MRKLKRSVVKRIFRFLGGSQQNTAKRRALSLLGYNQLTPNTFGEVAYKSKTLINACSAKITSPCLVGRKSKLRHETHSNLQAHFFKNAHVTAHTSAVVVDGRLALPDEVLLSEFRITLPPDGLFWHEPGYCVGPIRPKAETVPTGIMVGGSGASNWYHFIIECLPKAVLARELPTEYDDYPLLVPDVCKSSSTFKDALEAVAGDRKIRYFALGEILEVSDLISFNDVCIGPFNLQAESWPIIKDYSQHTDFLQRYLNIFTSQFLKPQKAMPTVRRRLFLTRPDVRRSYNQAKLLEIAIRYGFESYSPEAESLADQAQTFANAEMVVGASGAAWVGMVFCQKNAKFLSWLPTEYCEFCCYSSLAAINGNQMEFLDAIPDRALDSTHQAFVQSYQVNAREFEDALTNMTGDV